MPDTADLIRRARDLLQSHRMYGPFEASYLSLMLTRVVGELERLHEENKRLRASTFRPCEQCGRTIMSEDHP